MVLASVCIDARALLSYRARVDACWTVLVEESRCELIPRVLETRDRKGGGSQLLR
jgi:hypothetical protein